MDIGFDDFAVATSSDPLASRVFDLIDEHLTIPLKRLGLITLFNGLDITLMQGLHRTYL